MTQKSVATTMTPACRALVDGVESRAAAARRKARFLPRVERQKFIYDNIYRNDVEAVAYPLARVLGRVPDFATPGTYLEKLRSLYLTHPNPLMSIVADKAALRDYCSLFDLPLSTAHTIGVYDDPRDLDLSTLPPSCFLKVNDGCKMNMLHGPGMPITPLWLRIFRWDWWHKDHWRKYAELHYRDIPRKLLVEEALLPIENLHDCGIYCAMGKPYMFFTKTYKKGSGGQARSYIALDKNLECLTDKNDASQSLYDLAPRDQIDAMLETARILSKPFLNCRVDFMRIGNYTVIGEITLSPGALYLLPRDPEIEVIRGNLLDMERLPDLLAEGRNIAAKLGKPTETSFGHYDKDDPILVNGGQV